MIHQHPAAKVFPASFHASVAGLTCLDLDMHCDPAVWEAKVVRLRALLQRLASCTIHVNTAAITAGMLCQNFALLGQLRAVTVRLGGWGEVWVEGAGMCKEGLGGEGGGR